MKNGIITSLVCTLLLIGNDFAKSSQFEGPILRQVANACQSGEKALADREWDKAIRDFSDAIPLDPKSARSLTGRGNAWRRKGDWDKAIKDFGLSAKHGENPQSMGVAE